MPGIENTGQIIFDPDVQRFWLGEPKSFPNEPLLMVTPVIGDMDQIILYPVSQPAALASAAPIEEFSMQMGTFVQATVSGDIKTDTGGFET